MSHITGTKRYASACFLSRARLAACATLLSISPWSALFGQDGWIAGSNYVSTANGVTNVNISGGLAVAPLTVNTTATGEKAVYLFGGNYDGSQYYNAGMGGSVTYNGSNYVVGSDGGSSGGWLIRGTSTGEYFGIYTFASQCGAPGCGPWTVPPAAIEAYRRLTIDGSGNVGIGTVSPAHLLQVAGTIGAKEVIVSSTGADYVFDPGYRLEPLPEVEEFVRENHHLPDVPSAKEMEEKGLGVGEMQAKLLAKIEELTLHMIEAEKRAERMERENRELRERMGRIEAK